MALHLTLNGDALRLDGPTTILELMDALALDPRKVALERNLAIVPRSAYATTLLSEGDRIEIVAFIGGG